MRYLRATDDFTFAGRSRPGFPLILDASMEPAQPFHDYLLYRLLERGKVLDHKTWDAYGRRLWDFARFLDANDLRWNEPCASVGQSVVRIYRDWQAHDLKLDPTTINDRLELVAAMYRWAQDAGKIEHLPFTYADITVNGIEHDLAHVSGGRRRVSRPDVLLDEWDKEPAFLTADQLKVSRSSIRSASQRLLFDLMARVGLRSAEARTFPASYVFNPSARKVLKPGTLIEVHLDPGDMEIKFNKPRVVHVPYSLMEDMYAYATYERNAVAGDAARTELVLTTHGRAFSKESAVKVFVDLSERVGFRVRPLMLRHSYAIHTLLLLRSRPEVKLEPLLYVRDRLGHRSVQTTMVYLQQIERLLGAEALAMLQEFDRLYGMSSAFAEATDSQSVDLRNIYQTLPEVYWRLASHYVSDARRPFDHVVVDEAQDLSVPQLKLLSAMAADTPDGLFFAGDLGQRIFQLPFSWKSLGVDVRGRSRTLRVNYRTSHQIRGTADRLLGPEIEDVDGNVEARTGAVSVFNGPDPVVQTFPSVDAEETVVAAWLARCVGDGLSVDEMAVFVRTEGEFERAQRAIAAAGLPCNVLDANVDTEHHAVALGTMHLAKGLEFKGVAVMACDDEILPLQERIDAVTDEADLQEVYDTERHLLYVACTRARDRLLVSGVEPASEFLADLKSSELRRSR